MGRRSWRVVGVVLSGGLLGAACGSSSTGSSRPPATIRTAAPTTVPTTTAPPTTAAPVDFSSFTGQWYAHDTGGMTIAADGTGTVRIPDYLACPTCDAAGVPEDAIDFALHAAATGTATGVVVRSADPNGQDANGNTVSGAYAAGLPLAIGPGSTGTGRAVVVSVNGTRLGQFCDDAAQIAGTCGA